MSVAPAHLSPARRVWRKDERQGHRVDQQAQGLTVMLLQAPFVNRENFGPWLEARFPRGKGVEIGIDQADFAFHVLTGWKSCGGYWAVDPWITGYDPNDPVSNRKGY